MSTTAVIGAGGPTGFECVKRLLELGMPTVAIVRNPDKYKDTFPQDAKLQIRTGDVQDQASLKQLLLDTKAKHVIYAASSKTYWSAADVDKQVNTEISAVLPCELDHHTVLPQKHECPFGYCK